MDKPIRIGSRGSALALVQTREIIAAFESRNPGVTFEVVEIATHGDRFGETPIAKMGEHIERGIFNTGLEEAVLEGTVELATCSFKDVESELPAGLRAVSVGRREDVRDVLVTRHECALAGLPAGARLATSSPRRTSQLSAFRPDLKFAPLRGNVPNRVGPAVARFDGVIVAAAGLIRLGLQEKISDWISTEVLLPAPAQAALGCQFLEERADIARLVASIQEEETELCVRAEKKLLVRLSGGCFAPIGALARVEGGQLRLACRVVSLDGRRRVEGRIEGPPEEADSLTNTLAAKLTAEGAREIIEETRAQLQAI